MGLILHGYWRSSATYRARIALNLKGLEYAVRPVNLVANEHMTDAYRALNPLGLVPALEADGQVLTQSTAILEWLEETHPEPALLPCGADDRARVRAMASVIACDIQPVSNLRIRRALKDDLGAGPEQVDAWQRRWIDDGFKALEAYLGHTSGAFAWGDAPGLMECYLVPQAYNARALGMDLDAYPRLAAIEARGAALPAVAAAHPDAQPDAPQASLT